MSESFLRQNATAAAVSKPTGANTALHVSWFSSQYWFLLRPRTARAAQKRRRLSRFDSHLWVNFWYCTKELPFAVLSSRIPLFETREVDTTVLRWVSTSVLRMPWQVAAFTLVWKTRLLGDKLRVLRTISLAGIDDNMAINLRKTKPLVIFLNSKYFQESLAADLSPSTASGTDPSQNPICPRNSHRRCIASAHASNNFCLTADAKPE